MASKGLGVVYEKCSKEQKDELVSILVETLTTGKRCVLSTDHNITFTHCPCDISHQDGFYLEREISKILQINPEFGMKL